MKLQMWIGILIVLCSVFYVQPAIAQTPKPSQRFVCLNAGRCDMESSNCVGSLSSHRARIGSGQHNKALPDKTTYIAECLNLPDGPFCTTGNEQADTEVGFMTCDDNGENCRANITELSAMDIGYTYTGLFGSDGVTSIANPFVSSSTGEIGPFYWEDHTTIGLTRYYLAVNFFDALPGEIKTQGNTAMKQGTFAFNVKEEAQASNCIVLAWDPYGTVFDTQSLEPIPNVQVTLLKKRADSTYSRVGRADVPGGIINPARTPEDGTFFFVVPDGTYQLDISSSTHNFPSDFSPTSPLYARASEIYSDFYIPVENNTNWKDIVQKGAIQHRDIPLTPKGTPYTAPATLTGYTVFLDKDNNIYTISGTVSHPLASVSVYAQKFDNANATFSRSKQLGITNVNKDRTFSIDVPANSLETDEIVGEVEVIKNSIMPELSPTPQALINFLNWLIKPVFAQENKTVTHIDAPLNYIEGCAKNGANTLQRAQVDVLLNFSSIPFFTTIADENGCFTINSENLPTMPYKLRFTDTVSKRRIVSSLSSFVGGNVVYASENKINYHAKKTADPVLSITPKQTKNAVAQLKASPNKAQTVTKENIYNPVAYIVMTLIVLLAAGAIAFAAVYYKNRHP